jgi:EpsI family protein
LRFLIASSVFGCFFATIVYRSNWRRAFFILSSVLAPIIANGLRAFGLIWLAHLEGSATAMEADHVLYGWLFFTLVTLLLIAIGLMLPDRRDEPPIQTSVSSVSYIPRSGLRVAMVVGAALVLIAVGPAWLRASAPASAAPLQATLAEVVPGSDWARAQDDPAGWRPIMQGAGGIFPIAYRDGDMIASAYIVRYRLAAGAKPVSRMLNAIADPEIWQVTDTGRVLVPIDGQKVMVNTAMLKRQGFSRSVWWFYIIDGQMTARSLEARLLHARAALSAGQHLETFVAISAAASNASPDNATLRSFLKSFRAKEPAAPPGSGAISN